MIENALDRAYPAGSVIGKNAVEPTVTLGRTRTLYTK